MSAPAQRSVQEIARTIAAKCAYEVLTNYCAVELDREDASSCVRRAIAEAVKAVDARIESSVRNDLHEASHIVRASASGPGFANTFCLANRIGFIADGLDELGRAAK